MCERDEFFPNYERLFYVDTRLASRATTSTAALCDNFVISVDNTTPSLLLWIDCSRS